MTSDDETHVQVNEAGWEQRRVLSWNDHKGLNYMNWMFNNNVDDKLTFDW